MALLLVWLLGSAVGSFLAVAGTMHVSGQSLRGRSRCGSCKKELPWYTMMPVFSFLFLRGRCALCQKKYSSLFFWTEAITGVLFLLVWWRWVPSTDMQSLVTLIAGWILMSIVVVAGLSDLVSMLLPVLVLAGGGLVLFLIRLFIDGWSLSMVWPLLIGAGWFGIQYAVSRGRWVGVGDIWYGAFLGAVFSLGQLLVALFFSYIIGGVVAFFLLARGTHTRTSRVPFGVLLSLGAIISLLFGQQIASWYGQYLVIV